ncbi:ATP-binding cassette domain-containing protein [Algicola sagamiensis]|uniref:ATP-binding cassette domain-containing protein n=1 Tax=Algicola sagamiensis TaxID=163869 RepID=UPI000378D596|nr:ATP-binding cassette domain-containing protein [Algicola sagamiensis]
MKTENEVVLLKLAQVCKMFPVQVGVFKQKAVHAVQSVSLNVQKGKTLAIIGESGSGKSTLAKMIMQLEQPTSGGIYLRDEAGCMKNIQTYTKQSYARRIQMVFQDPYSSLNPRQQVWQLMTAPLLSQQSMSKKERLYATDALLEQVGLGEEHRYAFPHMLSGGQRQRVGIARALALKPELIVLDEALSALDVSIQAQMMNLLMSLQSQLDLTYLFISHDLNVVRYFADEVGVMKTGRLVEFGDALTTIDHPQHAYTKQLVQSTPGLIGQHKNTNEWGMAPQFQHQSRLMA